MLKKTLVLIKEFGSNLINGTISDTDLDRLLAVGTFTRSAGIGYVNPSFVTDDNHTEMDAIKDFVQEIGPFLSPDVLHSLNARIIARAPDRGENTFMRNSTLEKAFLAYEMVKSPELAEKHFESERIRQTFPRNSDIANLKAVILSPLIGYFQKPTASPDSDEVCYERALLKLKSLEIAPTAKLVQLLANIATLKATGNESLSELARALAHTHALLTDQMTVDDFKAQARTFNGAPSLGMGLVGGLMITGGLAVAAFTGGNSRNAAGAGTLAAFGAGFFAKSWQPTGLYKAMNDITEDFVVVNSSHAVQMDRQ